MGFAPVPGPRSLAPSAHLPPGPNSESPTPVFPAGVHLLYMRMPDEEPHRNAKCAYLCACIFASPLISGVKQSLELAVSGGGGRSALRPGGNSRACRVDRPPALFSHAEENPRPYEPAYSSSTGEGTGSGGPDRKLNSRRVL
jgi:hypothetical protein